MTETNPLGYEMTELLPTEKTAIQEVLVTSNRRYKEVNSNWDEKSEQRRVDDLNGWRIETQNRFTDIGFVVTVDPFDIMFDKVTGLPVMVPSIQVMGKTEDPGEFDHQRMARETQRGLFDGRAGKLKNNVWVSPESNF